MGQLEKSAEWHMAAPPLRLHSPTLSFYIAGPRPGPGRRVNELIEGKGLKSYSSVIFLFLHPFYTVHMSTRSSFTVIHTYARAIQGVGYCGLDSAESAPRHTASDENLTYL